MARIRTIKPEFPQSESIGRVSREARLCFILLWTQADDDGRLRGNSRMLASLLYPYDDDAKRYIDGWLTELASQGCIIRYEIDGDSYIEICKWLIHQKIDKPTKSKIPPPPCQDDTNSRGFSSPREGSSADQGGDQGGDQGVEGKKAAPSASRSRAATPAKPDDVLDQTWSDWLALRKSKRAPVTPTVLEQAREEAVKAGLQLEQFLRIWCARGSQGLQADWLKPAELAQARGAQAESFRERERRLAAEDAARWSPRIAASSSVLPPANGAIVITEGKGHAAAIASR